MKALKFLFLFFLCALLACTKDRTPEFVEKQVDFTGKWNAYGYTDYGGYVPLEIIEIIRRPNGEYVAYKVVGDNAVLSGQHTWRGRLDWDTNTVMFHFYGGPTRPTIEAPLDLIVKSPNCLASDKGYLLSYVRRVE